MGKKKGFFVFLCRIVIIVQIILVILPVIAIVSLSFVETKSIMTMIFPRGFTLENYLVIVEKGRVLKPIINSVKMSVMAVAAGLVLTVPTAYMIVRRGGRWNAVFKVLIMLPWAMPASVVAVNLINAFNHKSIFALNQSLIGGFYILPIAYTITSLPLLFSSNEVAVHDDGGNFRKARQAGGPPASLSSDDLVIARGQFSDGQRLDDSVLPDGFRQLGQSGLVEDFSGLGGAAFHLGDGQVQTPGSLGLQDVIAQKGAQPPAQSGGLFCCQKKQLLSRKVSILFLERKRIKKNVHEGG